MNIEKAEFLLEKLLDQKKDFYLQLQNNRLQIVSTPTSEGRILSIIRKTNPIQKMINRFMKVAI